MTQKTPLLAIWLVLSIVLIVRCRTTWALIDELRSDPDAYRSLATNLHDRGTYGLYESHQLKLLPTAFRPPLYPFLLRLTVPLKSPNSHFWIAGMHLFMGLLAALISWRLAYKWCSSHYTGLATMLFVAIDPILLQHSALVMTETVATLLAVCALLALSAPRITELPAWRAFVVGVLFAMCVLCRPTFLVWAIFVWLVFAVHDLVKLKGRSVNRVCGYTIGFLIAVSPWIVRNYCQIGELVCTTTHGGYTFYRANNRFFYEHLRSTTWRTPWKSYDFDAEWNDQKLQQLRDDSFETLNDKRAYAHAFEAIRSEPAMFVGACFHRVCRLWGLVPWQTDPNEPLRIRWLRYSIGVFYFVEFALAIVGVVALGRQLLKPPWVWGMLLVLSFTLVHTFYWTDMRMRAPLEPVIALVAAVGAGRVWTWMRPASSSGSPREAQGLQSLGLE